MDKNVKMSEILQHLRESEGESFTFQEEKLLFESEKRQAERSGMTIKVLSIFGGMLATVIFLIFLGIAGMYDKYQAILILGGVFIAVAVALNKIFNLLIIDTSTIAVYITGFCLIGYSLNEYAYTGNQINAIFISIAFVSILIAQNFVLAFVSVLIINGCFLALILMQERLNLVHIYNAVNMVLFALLMLRESQVITAGKIFSRLYKPLRIALVFSLMAGFFLVTKRWWMNDMRFNPGYVWLSSIATFGAALVMVSQLLSRFGKTTSKDRVIAYSICVPVFLAVAFLPSIFGSILVILMSFMANYKTGLVIGIMAFIYFITQFYYDLNFTLLTKSTILFASGVLFIACFVFTHLKWKSNEKV